MKNVSDEKALALQAVSWAVKRMANVHGTEGLSSMCPKWSGLLEETLSKLSVKELDYLEFLIESLRGHVATGTLPD